MRGSSTGMVIGLFLLSACGGAIGEKVRPKDFTGGEALNAAGVSCSGPPKMARPLLVDLDADARTDVEVAMKRGVVVVSYDCKTVEVVPGCTLTEGSYDYAGTNP